MGEKTISVWRSIIFKCRELYEAFAQLRKKPVAMALLLLVETQTFHCGHHALEQIRLEDFVFVNGEVNHAQK